MAESNQPADSRAGNYFFGDSLLFRLVAKQQASLVPELAELGAWAAHEETAAKARAARLFPPRLVLPAGGGAEAAAPALEMAAHPAYHGLLTRARHAGLAGGLYESGGEGAFARRARACRLALSAQAEAAPAAEMAQTSAAFGLLAEENPALAAALKPWAAGRIHDPSRRFYQAKQSISLSFALSRVPDAPRRAEIALDSARGGGFAAIAGGAPLYALRGGAGAVFAPLADGFIVSAAAEGEERLFFVPAFIAGGQSNAIAFAPDLPGSAAKAVSAAPCCGLAFQGSAGFLLGGSAAANARALGAAQDALAADYAALAAGSARAALRSVLPALRGAGETAGLRRRVAADAALDAAAAEVLALRLARARDKAAEDAGEAALAAALAPALSFWLRRFLPQLERACAELSGQSFIDPAGAAFAAALFPPAVCAGGLSGEEGDGALPALARLKNALSGQNGAFSAAAACGCAGLPKPMAESAKQILELAARKAAADENAVFLFADRLIYSFAASCFYALECGAVADAYAESRLGGARQTGYGDFGLRYNADFILEALYPNL